MRGLRDPERGECLVCAYIRKSSQSLNLINTLRDGLRISDITLHRMHLRTKRQLVWTRTDYTESVLDPDSGSDLVSSLAADLLSCPLQDVQLPEAQTKMEAGFRQCSRLVLSSGGCLV